MIKIIQFGDIDFEKYWFIGTKKIPGATPLYSMAVRKFEYEIFSSVLVRDDSFVVLNESGEVGAIVPLYCLRDDKGNNEYRYGKEYLRGPLISGEPNSRQYKNIEKIVFEYIEKIAHERNVLTHKAMVEGVEVLEGRHYYNYLNDFGYVEDSSICQIIDCTISQEKMWSNVRKSYRPLISRASKNYEIEIVDTENYCFEKCEEYRKLHFKAAGRQTRSMNSFYLMYEIIKEGNAFIVMVKPKECETVVATHFFYCLNIYCLYASSAVDPDLPSEAGVGHLALWRGIEKAKKVRCHYIDLGQLRIDSEPTEKEMNIALFKKGFGGRTVMVFRGTKYFEKT